MRTSSIAVKLVLAGSAALLVAGCGSRPAATANNSSSTANASAGLGAPMNDASAMEAASNASTVTPVNATVANTVDTAPPPSVGNGVESNVAGM